MDFVEELSAGRIEAVLFEGQRLAWLRSAACKELAGVTTSFGKLTSFDLLPYKGYSASGANFQHQRTIAFRLSFTWARARASFRTGHGDGLDGLTMDCGRIR